MVIFDLILLIILFIFVAFGWWLGLIQTLGALIGIALGAYLAGIWYVTFGDWLTPIFLGHDIAAKIVAFIILFTLINRLIGFLFWILSDKEPENPWMIFLVASATPSIIPTMLPPDLSVWVRKIGKTG